MIEKNNGPVGAGQLKVLRNNLNAFIVFKSSGSDTVISGGSNV